MEPRFLNHGDLNDMDKSANAQVVDAVMAATGGWPCLMDGFIRRVTAPEWQGVFNLTGLAEQMEEELLTNKDGVADALLSGCGIDQVRYGQSLVQLALEFGDEPYEELCELAAGLSDYPELQDADPEDVRSSMDALVRCGVLVAVARPDAEGTESFVVTCDPVVAKLVANR